MSKIQWTDKTENPIRVAEGGHYCIKLSPGCKFCYSEAMNRNPWFKGNGEPYRVRPEGHPEMTLNVDMLQKWGRMRKPKKIFVGSMTDIAGEWVPDWMIFVLFHAMAGSSNQTFQILTKRTERMAEVARDWLGYNVDGIDTLPSNIWLGMSAENQQCLDRRLFWLIKAAAQMRFLSLEPLLGPVVFPDCDSDTALMMQNDNPHQILEPMDYVDWVIIGGESGPNARPMDLAWVIDILAQCRAANIPAFVKQLGSHWAKRVGATHGKGGDPDEWPAELRVRMFPGEVWE